MNLSRELTFRAVPFPSPCILGYSSSRLPLLLLRFVYFSTFRFGMDNRGVNPILSLKDITPAAANNINARFILLDKGKTTTTGTKEGQNKTCLSLVADETASVHFQLWGYECDAFEPGDIIQLTNGIFSYSRNNLILRAGKRGKIVKVGEFTMSYVETPNISEIRWVPDSSDQKKYVKDVVLSPYSRMFPPLQ